MAGAGRGRKGQGILQGTARSPAGPRPAPEGFVVAPCPAAADARTSRRCRAVELGVARPPCCLRFVWAVLAAEVSGWG